MEILNRTVQSKVSETNLEGYGKITVTDKALKDYVGKKVEINIQIKEIN